MAATNPALQSLRDIHLPEAISFWPLAPGWYLLAALVLLIAGVISFYLYRHFAKTRAKKIALKKLINLQQQYQKARQQKTIAELSILLRQVALAYFPRRQVAGLQGEQWLGFLNKTGNTNAFTTKQGRLLISLPYQKKINDELTDLFIITKQWIKHV